MRQRFTWCLLVGTLAAATMGAEFQVNTHTTADQKDAAIAMDSAGNFVVVWASYLQDGSSNGVFAQRFDPNCDPVGEEFQVNTTAAGNQKEPSVAMNASGSFVVVWQGPGPLEEDEEDIFARRFDPNGLPLGEEFRVNSQTLDRQICPAAAIRDDGAFVVVWESVGFPAEGNRTICAQLYDSSGAKVGAEFVADPEPSVCRYPDVAMDAEGRFAIVWLDQGGADSIKVRGYASDGTAESEPFKINDIRFSSVTQPSVAMTVAKRFVVVWDGDPNRAGDDDIHALLSPADEMHIAWQFVVNTAASGAQQNPQVAMNDGQEFVVVWESKADPNVNERDICGRRYDGLGEPIGDEFQLNTYAEGDQRYPAVAIRQDGRFVAVWQSDGQDGSGDGIFAKAGPIVCAADLNDDGLVNLRDFCCFARSWCEQPASQTCDLNGDGQVDMRDLALLCGDWLSR
jgi:hypothetical protein